MTTLMQKADRPEAHSWKGKYDFRTVYFDGGTSVTWRRENYFNAEWELHEATGPNGETLIRQEDTKEAQILHAAVALLFISLVFLIIWFNTLPS